MSIQAKKQPSIVASDTAVRISPSFLGKASEGNLEFALGIATQAVNIGSMGPKYDKSGTDFIIATVKGIAPQDAVEAMLAMQIAAVHNAAMTFARRLAHVENIAQQDSAERAFNKLTRTFAAQVEALKRYRTGGQQQVIVKHVTVNEGGQAIVGNVAHGGGGAQ